MDYKITILPRISLETFQKSVIYLRPACLNDPKILANYASSEFFYLACQLSDDEVNDLGLLIFKDKNNKHCCAHVTNVPPLQRHIPSLTFADMDSVNQFIHDFCEDGFYEFNLSNAIVFITYLPFTL